jgi:ADP-ribose pyrophosphatase
LSLLEDYLDFAQANPALFANSSPGGITILLDEKEIREVEEQTVRRLTTQGKPAEWARVGIVYRDQYLLILRDAVRFPDGSLGTYIRLVNQYPGVLGVAVLPVYQGQILLVRHFRHATRLWHLEIPRGFGQELSAEEDAYREVLEEIGGQIVHLVSLGHVYPNTGMTSERVALFYAEVETYGNVEVVEAISEIVPASLSEVERMIRSNEIEDGFTLTAYALAKAKSLL